MVAVHNNSILADEIQSETEGLDLARVDIRKWSSFEWVTEDDLSAHQYMPGITRTVQLTTAAIFAATSELISASPRCTTWAP